MDANKDRRLSQQEVHSFVNQFNKAGCFGKFLKLDGLIGKRFLI